MGQRISRIVGTSEGLHSRVGLSRDLGRLDRFRLEST